MYILKICILKHDTNILVVFATMTGIGKFLVTTTVHAVQAITQSSYSPRNHMSHLVLKHDDCYG